MMVSFVCEAATTGPRCDTPQAGGARGTPLAKRLRGRERRKIDGDAKASSHHMAAGEGAEFTIGFGTQSRAGGLDALRAASTQRRTLARITEFPNRRRCGMRPATDGDG